MCDTSTPRSVLVSDKIPDGTKEVALTKYALNGLGFEKCPSIPCPSVAWETSRESMHFLCKGRCWLKSPVAGLDLALSHELC